MFAPKRLGNLLLILITMLLLFPVVLTLYMIKIIQNSELAMLENQKTKLARAVDDLDSSVKGSFHDFLASHNALEAPKQQQVKILNAILKEPIDQIYRKYPRVETGFYIPELDILIDGTGNFEENFSRRRKSAFQETLSRQQTITQTIGHGSAGILETYRPFYRNGKLEGVIWATENLGHTNYYERIKQIKTHSYSIIALGVLVGLGSSLILIRTFVTNIEKIKNGLFELQYDLNKQLPEGPGELGEISRAINQLATRLIDVYKYNELMMATIDDALLVIDSKGKVVIANSAAYNMFNLPSGVQEQDYREIFPKDSPFPELLQKTIEKQQQFQNLKLSWLSPKGKIIQLLASTALLLTGQEQVVGAVLCCRDVTERMQMEEKYHRQERLAALGKLVAGVAHEIRNPLTSISCYIQLWQKSGNPSLNALNTMYKEVSRLENLVEQLLYFTRLSQARFVPYDLNRLVEKTLNFFADLYKEQFTIVKNLSDVLPLAWIDPEQIERVLMNIIYNACQAMSGGGKLEVQTMYDQQLIVSITDTGCGIPPEDLEHLFDPFFTTKTKGTGLGLAIAHEIIQAHGGNIEVESKVGQGSTFRIFLPAKL